jgi:hypothetical protein
MIRTLNLPSRPDELLETLLSLFLLANCNEHVCFCLLHKEMKYLYGMFWLLNIYFFRLKYLCQLMALPFLEASQPYSVNIQETAGTSHKPSDCSVL